MIEIEWKNGNVDVRNVIPMYENYDLFELIFSENGIPYIKQGLDYNFTYSCYWKFYIEYEVQVWGINKKTQDLDLLLEKHFNCQNQNLLIELEPRNQVELDVWSSYTEMFSEKKNCNIYLKINPKYGDFTLQESNNYHRHEENSQIDFYSRYKICWEKNHFINPLGIDNMSPYNLINNALLKI